ncbi:MAG: hypothetical protein ACLS7Z_11235, partial [Christensenellales bacterium]
MSAKLTEGVIPRDLAQKTTIRRRPFNPIRKAASFRKRLPFSSLTDDIIPHFFPYRNLTFGGHFSDIARTSAGHF